MRGRRQVELRRIFNRFAKRFNLVGSETGDVAVETLVDHLEGAVRVILLGAGVTAAGASSALGLGRVLRVADAFEGAVADYLGRLQQLVAVFVVVVRRLGRTRRMFLRHARLEPQLQARRLQTQHQVLPLAALDRVGELMADGRLLRRAAHGHQSGE